MVKKIVCGTHHTSWLYNLSFFILYDTFPTFLFDMFLLPVLWIGACDILFMINFVLTIFSVLFLSPFWLFFLFFAVNYTFHWRKSKSVLKHFSKNIFCLIRRQQLCSRVPLKWILENSFKCVLYSVCRF